MFSVLASPPQKDMLISMLTTWTFKGVSKHFSRLNHYKLCLMKILEALPYQIEIVDLMMNYQKIWYFFRSILQQAVDSNACFSSGKLLLQDSWIIIHDCFICLSLSECLCIPWNMPRPNNSNADLCDSYGNMCFFTKMQNFTYQAENCNCIPKCNTVKFSSHFESSIPLKGAKECDAPPVVKYSGSKISNIPMCP